MAINSRPDDTLSQLLESFDRGTASSSSEPQKTAPTPGPHVGIEIKSTLPKNAVAILGLAAGLVELRCGIKVRDKDTDLAAHIMFNTTRGAVGTIARARQEIHQDLIQGRAVPVCEEGELADALDALGPNVSARLLLRGNLQFDPDLAKHVERERLAYIVEQRQRQ